MYIHRIYACMYVQLLWIYASMHTWYMHVCTMYMYSVHRIYVCMYVRCM